MASSIFAGRYVARSTEEFVLFRIGMRFNGLRGIVPALQTFFMKMPGMLAEQHANPEIGMLSSSVAFSWRVVELTQIWRSFDDLERYATVPQGRHTNAWRWFNHLGRKGEGTGVWHETYRVAPGSFEAVYVNMPRYGLAAGIDHVAVPAGSRNSVRRSSVSCKHMATTEKAILAGGCFWGVQDLLRSYPGVLKTRVGYSGGEVPNATYRNHGTHAEAVEILFDPEKISYRTLLEFFFQIHDPSTPNRQGNDRGPSYRSAIYYTSDEQKHVAEETIADVDASHLWPGKVVTEVAPAGDFWEAEPEHQDYLVHYPGGYTCHFVRPNWKLPARSIAR